MPYNYILVHQTLTTLKELCLNSHKLVPLKNIKLGLKLQIVNVRLLIQEMLQIGIIRHSTNTFSSHFVSLKKKKDGHGTFV